MNIIGISCFYHDSAAALITNGRIISAAQEERFTRIKHDASFPFNSITYCLNSANLELSNIDAIVFYEKPFIKFERLLETYLQKVPFGFSSFKIAIPLWTKEKLFQRQLILKHLFSIEKNSTLKDKLFFTDHHHSHAASAFYPSPFKEAAVLTMDGVGEWATTSVYIGKNNSLELKKEINFPHSLGLLYSAFTYFLGFKVNDGEYKIMGLAPYGQPKYKAIIKDYLIDIKKDGSFKLNQKFFNYSTGLTMTNNRFEKLFKANVRKEKDNLEQKHMDIAASVQSVIEDVILSLTKNIFKEYGIKNLCLAGGVALNCVANGKILKQGYFKNLWIQPAAGDAGGSLGSALAIYYEYFKKKRIINVKKDLMRNAYLGPHFDNYYIKKFLDKNDIKYKFLNEKKLISEIALSLTKGKTIGWFQDKMEFGPRALGNRSILADPRSEKMQKNLNLKIKFRESFRPFAPIVLRKKAKKWFDLKCDSPYMLLVADVHKSKKLEVKEKNFTGLRKLYLKRSVIPAVTHVDYSARIQTLEKKDNKYLYKLLQKFDELTNCPVLVNTSFNIKDEPIVCSPLDAYKCFTKTNLDILVLGNYIIDNKKVKLN